MEKQELDLFLQGQFIISDDEPKEDARAAIVPPPEEKKVVPLIVLPSFFFKHSNSFNYVIYLRLLLKDLKFLKKKQRYHRKKRTISKTNFIFILTR